MGEVAELAGLEGGEFEKADADALQFFDEETEVFEHHADLVLAAFGELDLIPGVIGAGQYLEAGGLGADAEQGDAGAEFADLVFAESAVGFDDVSFDDVRSFAHDGVGEIAIIGEQEEAFGVIVEAADGVDAFADAA